MIGASNRVLPPNPLSTTPATHAPSQIHAAPASAIDAVVLSEPPDISDETVATLTRAFNTAARERDGSTAMELIGESSISCAKVLLQFFQEHVRAHVSDDIPNAAAWRLDGVDATLDPPTLLPIDAFNRIRLVRS